MTYMEEVMTMQEEMNISDIYKRVQVKKKEKKGINEYFKEQMLQHAEYQQIIDDLERLKAKKKQIELMIKEGSADQWQKLESLTLDIRSDRELLTDLAVNKMMRNESVEVHDEHQNKFVPYFSVTFKKIS